MTPIDDKLIEHVTRTIVEKFNPRRIVLFGSHARGEARSDSDLDLMIEMDSDEKFLKRHLAILRALRPRDWPLDLVVFTPDEVSRSRNIVGSMVQIIEEEGRTLYANH